MSEFISGRDWLCRPEDTSWALSANPRGYQFTWFPIKPIWDSLTHHPKDTALANCLVKFIRLKWCSKFVFKPQFNFPLDLWLRVIIREEISYKVFKVACHTKRTHTHTLPLAQWFPRGWFRGHRKSICSWPYLETTYLNELYLLFNFLTLLK